jgi:hypothetical protein
MVALTHFTSSTTLGSFLLSANEVIDPVPMSACGSFSDLPTASEDVCC